MNTLHIKNQSYKEQQQLESVVANAIDIAKKKVDSVEIAINKSTGINVSTRLGETENIEFNSDGVLAITVYQDQRKGNASTNDLSPQAIEQTINMAIEIMKYTSADPYSGLGDKSQMAFDCPDLDLFYPSALNVDEAIKQAAKAEMTALNYTEIINSDGGHFNSSYGIHVYGNSEGMLQGYRASSHALSCSVIAERDGQMERDYAYTSSRDINLLKSAESVGVQAADKTIANLGAQQIATMQVPVLFSAEVATGLIGHLASAISGSAIYKKSSFLLDKIGQKILPNWLTIKELPHLLKEVGSAPFDSDGIRTFDKDIINNGILQTYLLSSYSARKLSTQEKTFTSTGNAGGIHNWRLKSTHLMPTFAQLLKIMDRGIVVTSLMGQGVNLVTGDYSRGASGFWVENGQIQYPINEFTIADNLSNMYSNIIAIGSDIERRTNIQCGSILIEKMSIAGK
ncbi:metalloprotease PmbA [Orbus sturtevantii]|uniref:metalloprotease PmbA n=1 Tax=Orbus sturtevantii TaxID=3074109 RepID=UPI00370DE153